MRKFKKFFTFVFSTVLAASSVLSTSSMAVTPADVEAKDPNGDGVITMADVAFMYQILGGKYGPSDLTRFDIDDNDVVSDVDAIYTQMYTAGMLSNSVSPTPGDDNSSIMSVAETSSTSRNYRVYNAQTGAYLRNYSLEVENFDSTYNMRSVIGDTDDRVEDWSNIGVAKIMNSNSYLGTGFVVGRHTIATAAHCVYLVEGQYAKLVSEIKLFDTNGTSVSFTPVETHIPSSYNYTSAYNENYDYALITVEEDLKDYMSFNLGLITDNAPINELQITTVGFPQGVNNLPNNHSAHHKIKSEEKIVADSGTNYNFLLCHTADTATGSSGCPIYVEETLNGKTYNTVVGINVTGYTEFNRGVRFTPHLLKFLKGNSNIQY